ncbi:putative nuclease HARBI1 [Ceratitis capitata]|uniref:putative nuclease HARBI1 n=1 Tax=Ceratitis capitata TaxID=7213 RepID=UPI00032A2354|nr:putative nuclease HARBI1 [Ceratitis capitata]
MEEELLLLLLLMHEETINPAQLRRLRDHSDPFSMSNEDFERQFVVPKFICRSLIENLLPHDKQNTGLSFTIRLLAALNFYGTGRIQKRVGDDDILNVSQPTVSRALTNVTDLLISQFCGEICFPDTSEEQRMVKEGFKEKFGLENIVGVIGTAHINLLSPTEKAGNASAYANEFNKNSIKVEGICDHRFLFTSLNARSPGSVKNSTIWHSTPAREFLSVQYKQAAENTFLLGDDTYPLEPWLLTPLQEIKNRADASYNERHSNAHNTIRHTFGLLRTRFKCLSKGSKLYYTHERGANIIYACSILHNILQKRGYSIKLDESELNTASEEHVTRKSESEVVQSAPQFVNGCESRQLYIRNLNETV